MTNWPTRRRRKTLPAQPGDGAELTAAEKSSETAKVDEPLAAEAGFKDDGAPAGFAGEWCRTDSSRDHSGRSRHTSAGLGGPGQCAWRPAVTPVDAGKPVTLPDGTPITAPTEQAANATRAVLSGQSVTDAYKAQGIDIPPPGAPVTTRSTRHVCSRATSPGSNRDPGHGVWATAKSGWMGRYSHSARWPAAATSWVGANRLRRRWPPTLSHPDPWSPWSSRPPALRQRSRPVLPNRRGV